jgi:hypothetical protein
MNTYPCSPPASTTDIRALLVHSETAGEYMLAIICEAALGLTDIEGARDEARALLTEAIVARELPNFGDWH